MHAMDEALLFQVSEGNPGALSVCLMAYRINPVNLVLLGAWDVRGSDLWVRYKKCGKDIVRLLTVAAQEVGQNI